MQIVGALQGSLEIEHPIQSVVLHPGEFCLIPASESATLTSDKPVSFLRVTA